MDNYLDLTDEKILEIKEKLIQEKNKKINNFANIVLLIISLLLYYFIGNLTSNPIDILILILILFFHEFGHLTMMKLFGYKDLKIFFIPFLGAAASGKSNTSSQVKKIIILLAGPLPGIFYNKTKFDLEFNFNKFTLF